MDRLLPFRQFYADLVTASVGVRNRQIRDAFAGVAREDFLGAGPWHILVEDDYIETPNDDPALLYQDIVVAIDASRRINNGEPSLHARCLAAIAVTPGDAILHIGCGAGYYSAILAALAGPAGKIVAIEIQPEIAARARRNLAHLATVEVHCRSGAEAPLPASDAIYVNAGATPPLAAWLAALNPGGRLIFPLTPGWDHGAMLLVRRGNAMAGFEAKFIASAGFIPCLGGQDEQLQSRLKEAFEGGEWRTVCSLRTGHARPDQSCWFEGDGWWLSTDSVH